MDQESNEHQQTSKCYPIKEHLLENLRLSCSESTCLFILWNKYQLYAYENLEFSAAARIIVPEFQVADLFVSNNYLVCLDCSGNLHVTSMKFKSAAQKRFKSSFQPREQNILSCQLYDPDSIISLKLECGSYSLCLHKITPDLQLEKRITVECGENWPKQRESTYLINCHELREEDYLLIKENFKSKATFREHKLILFSLDCLNVYGCLISSKSPDTVVKPIKIYSSPAEICDIKVKERDLEILIGLSIGTVVRLFLKDNCKTEVVHLNVALTKFINLSTNSSLVFSNGLSLWKAEYAFTKELKFQQFFVRNVKDFLKYKDQIVCATYSNLIYTFPINEKSYLKVHSVDNYCPAEKLLVKNINYLKSLTEECKKGQEITEKIKQEKDYLLALSLCKRQEIMNGIIQLITLVYDDFNKAITENSGIKLIEERSSYFETDIFFIFIRILMKTDHEEFHKVLTNIFNNLKIHITLISRTKVVKTSTIKLTEPLKKVEVLVPIHSKDLAEYAEITVDTKIVTCIPGVRKEAEKLWAFVYKNKKLLSAEHFIKRQVVGKSIDLKEPEDGLNNLIHKVACCQHGGMINFIDTTVKLVPVSMYAKLSSNYKESFANAVFYNSIFSPERAKFIQKQFTSEAFLNARDYVCLEIGNNKVHIAITDELSHKLVKVTSTNAYLAFSIRNFMADLMANDYKSQVFVPNSVYSNTENLKRCIKEAIQENSQSRLSTLAEQFHKTSIGGLPI